LNRLRVQREGRRFNATSEKSMMKKLPIVAGIAALSLMSIAVQAQVSRDAMTPSSPASSSSGMPADITPSTPSPGMSPSGTASPSGNYGNSGSYSAPYTSTSPYSGGSMTQDTSQPATREQVQADTLRAMRMGTIVQGEATPPEQEVWVERAQHSMH
jgi:hypothetical protein